MTDKKLEIAEEFVSLHKPGVFYSEPDLNAVYHELINGEYGEVREGMPGELEIEISSSESRTGLPVLFTWGKLEDESC